MTAVSSLEFLKFAFIHVTAIAMLFCCNDFLTIFEMVAELLVIITV